MDHLSFSTRARFAFAAVVAALVLPAQADLSLDSSLTVETDGNVFVTFLGYSASYSSDLYLQSPGGPGPVLFNNHSSLIGTTIDLGYFTAGTELVFGLHVNNTGYDFFTGDPSSNPDGLAHAAVLGTSGFGTVLGFEDLFGGGDKDYNDLIFAFNNLGVGVSGPGGPVPDTASSISLLGLALLGISAARRRFRQ